MLHSKHSGRTKRRNERKRAILSVQSGIVSWLVLLCASAPIVFCPAWGEATAEPAWKVDFAKGLKLFPTDQALGSASMQQAINDSEHKATVAERMSLYRQFGVAYYHALRYAEGDQQIQAAIALCQSEKPNSEEADQLTHAYQDRGWADHERWLARHDSSPGDKDQELAVAVAEKNFGPEHEQTIYKIPALAVIYNDLDQKDKAHALIERALTAINTNPGVKQCAWFVHGMYARIKAVDRDYNGAMTEYLLARSLANDTQQKKRVWSEFKTGLKQNSKHSIPEVDLAGKLIKDEQFAQLDQLMDKLRKAGTALASGDWVLDRVYYRITHGDREVYTADTTQRIYELKKWLAAMPGSVSARVALSACYTEYAWEARGGGYSDTVSSQGWKIFASRLALAKATQDEDPAIRTKCPYAYQNYDTIALGQGMEKDAYLRQQTECHKQWPTYHSIDEAPCIFLLPRWYGEKGDSERYITERADSIPGPKGDELYAQLGWRHWYWFDYPKGPGTILKWTRTRSGFAEILKDFPDDIDARIAYVDEALSANDSKSAQSAFDGYK